MSRILTISDALANMPHSNSTIEEARSHGDPYYIVKHASPETREGVTKAVKNLVYTTGESWVYHKTNIPKQGGECMCQCMFACLILTPSSTI